MSESRRRAQDEHYLRMACRLAKKGAGRTSPNPPVGAVLVRQGKIVGRGYHRFAGGDHAEIVALKNAGVKARGASLYITLEPCNHHGRTPPCTGALIRAGVKEIVCGTKDPNPHVSGNGIRRLRRAGIRVRTGVLETECRNLIEPFAKYITRGMPWVALKLAATLDGRIATAAGDSRWVSGERSRRIVHVMRNEFDAVLVGFGTVKADDPQLTCRLARGRNPWRIILDSRLRIPLSASVFKHDDPGKTIVVTGAGAAPARVRAVEALGAQVWRLPVRQDKVLWTPLLKKMAETGIVAVMIEGGAATAASALAAKIVDRIIFFYAPKIIGADGLPMIEGLGVRRMRDALVVTDLRVERSGADLIVIGDLQSGTRRRAGKANGGG